MTFDLLQDSLRHAEPPAELDHALTGMWWDAKGDWTKAHESAQQDEGPRGSWVHAYLHRKEGDASNAAYWYGRAGRTAATGQLTDEWTEIVKALACVVGRALNKQLRWKIWPLGQRPSYP